MASCMQDTQYTHCIDGQVIDQYVVAVDDKLACAKDPARSAKLGMVLQAFCTLRENFVKSQCCGWVVLGDVVTNFSSVGCCGA